MRVCDRRVRVGIRMDSQKRGTDAEEERQRGVEVGGGPKFTANGCAPSAPSAPPPHPSSYRRRQRGAKELGSIFNSGI